MERAAPVGLWLVMVSQIAYVFGSFSFGGPGIGTVASAVSAACAGIAASALSRGDRSTFAWALVTFAAVQGLDYVTSFNNFGAFFIGFTLLVAGLIVASTSALRWRREGADAPRPHGVRFGAGLASLGTLTYLVGGFLGGFNFSAFTIGVIAAGIGWALVAMA